MKAISGLEYFAEVWKGDPVVDKVLAYVAELEAENAACEEWGKSEARMKERAEATIERLKYILDRIEMSGQEEMLAQYACDWAERRRTP